MLLFLQISLRIIRRAKLIKKFLNLHKMELVLSSLPVQQLKMQLHKSQISNYKHNSTINLLSNQMMIIQTMKHWIYNHQILWLPSFKSHSQMLLLMDVETLKIRNVILNLRLLSPLLQYQLQKLTKRATSSQCLDLRKRLK